MSQISKTVFGAIALSLALGAVPLVPLAFGQDLAERWQAVAAAPATAIDAIDTVINRSAKADRAGVLVEPAVPTRTIVIRLDSLVDTSVLVRIPVASKPETKPEKDALNGPAPSLFKSGDRRKATVACEPMVSVLSEVAKLLEPGRCVT